MKPARVLLLFSVALILSSTLQAGTVNVSLNPADWTTYGNVTSSYTKQNIDNYLRFSCNSYRGYIGFRSIGTHDLRGATVRYRWRMSSPGNYYCWSTNGTNVNKTVYRHFNIHHSWAGGTLVSGNTWIYTEIIYNPDRTYRIDQSYSGYGYGGIYTTSSTLTQAQYDALENGFIYINGGDNYTVPMYIDIDDIQIVTPYSPLNTEIISPADNSYYEPNETISFLANAEGGEEPYSYQWTSSVDGNLSDANSFDTSSLSIGSHFITFRCQDANSTISSHSIHLNIFEPPVISEINDDTASDNSAYAGPIPSVNSSAGNVSWTVVQGPSGMTINTNGQVYWPNPIASPTPYTITIQAQNPLGSDTEQWQLTVLAWPEISDVANATILEGQSYTSPAPAIIKGEDITFSIRNAPSGSTIDPNTGVITWPVAIAAFTPYNFGVRATNPVGYDEKFWQVTVESSPVINSISDAAVEVNQPFSYSPTLSKGLPAVSWSLTNEPAGMAINSATGQINWAGSAAQGTYNITVQAQNIHGSDTKSFQLKVINTPELASISDMTVNEAQAFSYQPVLIKGEDITWFVAGAAGVSINPVTGLISWPRVVGNYSPYTITVRAQNAVGFDQKSFILDVVKVPIIANISDDIVVDGNTYTGPLPTLYQGSSIVWSIVNAPAGAAIDANTGVVTFGPVSYSPSAIDIEIKAENTAGFDTERWDLEVVQAPAIEDINDAVIVSAQPYTSPRPSITQGSHISFSIVNGPAGATINQANGTVSWPNPTASEVDITVKAQNIAGSDTKSWHLSVLDKPVIAAIADDSTSEGQSYSSTAPALTQGAVPVTFTLTNGPEGMTIDENTGVVSWPEPTASNNPYAVTIKAQNQVGYDEKSFNITVNAGYTATVSTDVDIAPAQSVALTGLATWTVSGNPAANVPVIITVKLKSMARTLSVVTDVNGAFNTTFNPLSGEAGLYTIAAHHPISPVPAPQDQFTLVAIKASPVTGYHSLYESSTVTGSFDLKNLGDTSLSGITYQISGPNSVTVDVNIPADMNASETVTVDYNLTALNASIFNTSTAITITSSEGASAVYNISARVQPLVANVVVAPETLQAGMVRGQRTSVEFAISNVGGAATAPLTVLIPDVNWLSMFNPEVIGPVDANSTTVINLQLSPGSDAAIGNYTGSILVYGQGINKTIPFEFICTSSAVGGLDISATDEYTYYGTGSPKVADATVNLKDLITGQIIYHNQPMVDGELLIENLPESYYELEVMAPEHDIYKRTVIVVPGVNSRVNAFMSRQLVTYTWTVLPTEIPDQYTVTLTQTFKTSVPAPVVVIEPANVDISDMNDGQKQVNFEITNYGLVAAEDFHLVFDQHPIIEVELLVDFNGTVGPNETIVIPAIIRDKSYSPDSDNLEMDPSPNCDPKKGGGYYTLVCGDDKKWHRKPITIANWLCELGNLLPNIPDSGGGYDYDDDDDDGPDWYSDDDDNDDPPYPSRPGGREPAGGGTLVIDPGKPSTPGTPGRPSTPSTTIVIPRPDNGHSRGGCDPCPRKQLENLLNCGLAFVPSCGFQLYMATSSCASACGANGIISQKCFIACGHGYIAAILECVEDTAGKLAGVGIVWNLLGCLYGAVTACDDLDADMYRQYIEELNNITGGELDLPGELPDTDDAMADLVDKLDKITMMMEAPIQLFGDPAWFSGQPNEANEYKAVVGLYMDAIDDDGDQGGKITEDERAALLASPAHAALTADIINYTCDRWNRTLDYWSAGKFTIADLDPNDNTDFIDSNVYMEKWTAAGDIAEQMQAQGYENILEPLKESAENLKIALAGNDEGVCAKVQMQITQRAVMTRSAFRATLTMSNDSQIDTLMGIIVDVNITDLLGNNANSSFGIYPPEVTGIADLNGNGNLAPGGNMQAQWLIVPNSDAAPIAAKDYLVGGTISYTINGSLVTIPLSPDIITVKPDPRLTLKYFFETDVYSDDPFTPETEPAVPFSLGLMITNTGAGTAHNFSITSALPKIIRHQQDKDILIDFDLIGASIDANAITPALALSLGDIEPNQTKVARWLMTTSLQGEFVDYNAVFAHIDPLGDPKLSLLDSIQSHQTIHPVKADYPEDDGICDFLTNDIPDINGAADSVHLSDGSVEPVTAMLGYGSWITGVLSDSNLTLTLTTPHKPLGFAYIRVPNPGYGSYELVSVIRSDGKAISMPCNSWTTHKIVREIGQPDVQLDYIHIFDHAGNGQYTLTFVKAGDSLPVVHDVNITDVTSDIGSELLFEVTYTDNNSLDVSSFDSNDIKVTGPYSFERFASFISTDINSPGKITVHYSISAPGGFWDSPDNGMYQLAVMPNQVSDDAGNFVSPGVIAGFIVNFPSECNDLEVVSYNLIAQRRVTRTIFDYDYSVTVKNNCMNPVGNFRFVPDSIPPVMTLLYHDVTFDSIGPFDTATGNGYFTVRMDYQVADHVNGMGWHSEDMADADFSGDGVVNFIDLAMLCQYWLTNNANFDIAPIQGDNIVNMLDFEALANQWLDETNN